MSGRKLYLVNLEIRNEDGNGNVNVAVFLRKITLTELKNDHPDLAGLSDKPLPLFRWSIKNNPPAAATRVVDREDLDAMRSALEGLFAAGTPVKNDPIREAIRKKYAGIISEAFTAKIVGSTRSEITKMLIDASNGRRRHEETEPAWGGGAEDDRTESDEDTHDVTPVTGAPTPKVARLDDEDEDEGSDEDEQPRQESPQKQQQQQQQQPQQPPQESPQKQQPQPQPQKQPQQKQTQQPQPQKPQSFKKRKAHTAADDGDISTLMGTHRNAMNRIISEQWMQLDVLMANNRNTVNSLLETHRIRIRSMIDQQNGDIVSLTKKRRIPDEKA